MKIVVVGTNHKRAPIEVREKIAFKPGQDKEFLNLLVGREGLAEAVVLSTCNRTEVYAVCNGEATPEHLWDTVLEYHNLDDGMAQEHVYTMVGEEAVNHLFEVSCSLDSLVLGESQILSQVKSAFSLAKENGATGAVLNFLFQKCFKAAKEVYATTGIARNKVSVSSVAVELAQQKLGQLSDKAVLIVGSGKVGRLSAKHFVEKGISKVFVANRTPSRAQAMAAKVGAEMVPLESINKILPHVDIVVGCTSARQHILHRKRCSDVLKSRGGKPLFILDLGVPRNVAPEVATLGGVYLYNIDQLEEIAVSHMLARQGSASKASEIVQREVKKTIEQLEASERREVISDLLAKFEAVREAEVSRSLGKLGELTEKQKSELQHLTKRIVNKILHDPLSKLKPPVLHRDRRKYLDILQTLFS